MRLRFLRGSALSDKEKKFPPLDPSSLHSSSGLPSTDHSLERVLGAIEKTIRSFESVLHMVHTEVTTQGKLSLKRHEIAYNLLGKIRVELATLADQVRTLSQSHSIQLGATVEARQALDRSRDKLEQMVKDVTGEHALLDPNDEQAAPHAVRVFAIRFANFAWPVAMRGGRAAALWGVKLLAGSTALAGLAKILHDLIAGAG